jgi:hypothetical protein
MPITPNTSLKSGHMGAVGLDGEDLTPVQL